MSRVIKEEDVTDMLTRLSKAINKAVGAQKALDDRIGATDKLGSILDLIGKLVDVSGSADVKESFVLVKNRDKATLQLENELSKAIKLMRLAPLKQTNKRQLETLRVKKRMKFSDR